MLSPSLNLTEANAAALRSSATRVVVVGPSGWLGSAAIAMLDRALPPDLLGRRVVLFGSRARSIPTPSGNRLECLDCAELAGFDLADSVVLHFGYLTKDRTQTMGVADYVRANDAIQDVVLRAVRASPPHAFFFASSGAVYGGKVPGKPTAEENLYGWMKAKHEEQFTAAADAGVSVINGRIFTLSGEFINKMTLYALASFLSDLRDGKPIEIQSTRPVWRSYIYVADVINLALALMLGRHPSLTLDVAGEETVEIGRLAAMCAEVAGKGGTSIHRPGYSADKAGDRMIGDHETVYGLMARAGIAPLPLAQQIAATASYLGGGLAR